MIRVRVGGNEPAAYDWTSMSPLSQPSKVKASPGSQRSTSICFGASYDMRKTPSQGFLPSLKPGSTSQAALPPLGLAAPAAASSPGSGQALGASASSPQLFRRSESQAPPSPPPQGNLGASPSQQQRRRRQQQQPAPLQQQRPQQQRPQQPAQQQWQQQQQQQAGQSRPSSSSARQKKSAAADAGVQQQGHSPSRPRRLAPSQGGNDVGSPPVSRQKKSAAADAGVQQQGHSPSRPRRLAPSQGGNDVGSPPVSRKPRRGGAPAAADQGRPAIEAPSVVCEESGSLGEIRAVASGISGDLDNFFRSSATLRGEGSGDLASDIGGLQEISSIACKVQDKLNQPIDPVPAKQPEPAPSPSAPYDDPLLSKARKITALTNQLCRDLQSSCQSIAEPSPDRPEVSPLHEISAITRQVLADMSKLQEDAWGSAALASVPSKAQAAADDKLPCGIRIEAHHAEAGPQEPDEEPRAVVPPPDGSNYRFSVERASACVAHVEGLPDLDELLHGGEDGSELDTERVRTAFKRFRLPGEADLHLDDLCGVMAYLGYIFSSDKEKLMPLVREVTNFDYLDFDEFMSFMSKYIPFEQDLFRVYFDKFDEDQSGEISIKELRILLQELGFIPTRGMIREALQTVDQDGNGNLGFTELVTFLAVYRRAEGFTQSEVVELRNVFDRFSKDGGVPNESLAADKLSDALVQAFGLHIMPLTEQMEQELQNGQAQQKSSSEPGKPENLHFPEFLIFARKARELALDQFRGKYGGMFGEKGRGRTESEEFSKADTDGNGSISESELRAALKAMGYTPVRQDIEEFLEEVDKTTGSELDMNEFFDFQLIFLQREGFNKASVEEFRKVFDRFDTECNAEISALELSDLFRHLGYRVSVDDVHMFVQQVDANGSNELDFREFMRLMRLHREDELQKIKVTHKGFENEKTGRIPRARLTKALMDLDHEPPASLLQRTDLGDVLFDDFVEIVDSCRGDFVRKERKKAGFTDAKIEEFRARFGQYDKDKSGDIDCLELIKLLKEFDWEPKTREEQQQLMQKLDVARGLAQEAGIAVVNDGSATLEFWTFVQLSRLLESEQEHAEEKRMDKLMHDLSFSVKEVDDFRHVFLAKKKEAKELEDLDEIPDGLPRFTVERLVRSLGVRISQENKTKLEEQLAILGCAERTLLDFPGFLQLMRWLMDCDFAGINQAAATKTK